MNNCSYINSQWIKSENPNPIVNIDPATLDVVATINSATDLEAELAIKAAKSAFETWGQTSGTERGAYLVKIADVLERDKDKLMKLSSKINGKPLSEAEYDLDDAIATFRYYAKAASDLDARQETEVPLSVEGISSYVRHEPAGVAVLITPWNFPLVTSSWKIAPALAAGCTIILKPAEAVSLIELEWGRISTEVDLPLGVLNILPGHGAEIGEILTTHHDIDKISFTGGNQTGATIASLAAPTVKSVSLELGGKSAIVVFDDADIEKAVEAIIAGIFFNCGQMCSATSRLIVHESLSEPLLKALVNASKELKVDSYLGLEPEMGPMTTQKQYDVVLGYFETAKLEGLECLIGGDALDRKGLFIAPTIYKNVPSESLLWKNEIFGPVLCTQTFSTQKEALNLAHDTVFGLAATLCGNDKIQLREFSKKLKAGHIWWNMPQIVPVETSWGGFGQSGTGRELGPWGLSAFLEVKHVEFEA